MESNNIYSTLKNCILNNDKSGFNLVYQPKINLEDNHIISWEVLSRWSNPKMGVISPSEFMPIIIAEEKEYEFDMYVFESMCKDISKIDKLKNTYSINISVNTLKEEKVIDDIVGISEKYKINPKNIIFEVLETSQIHDYDRISGVIDKLDRLGYKISIDDFGTGYSSYHRLSSMNFNEIKIPKEFLPTNNSNKEKQVKILKSMVDMGKSLGCKIVIEGIETLENHELAKKLGIDYGQGYLYYEPMPYNDYVNIIKHHKTECKNKNYST